MNLNRCFFLFAVLLLSPSGLSAGVLNCTCVEHQRTYYSMQPKKPESLTTSVISGCEADYLNEPTKVEIDEGYFVFGSWRPLTITSDTQSYLNGYLKPNPTKFFEYNFNKKTRVLRVYKEGKPDPNEQLLSAWNISKSKYQCN